KARPSTLNWLAKEVTRRHDATLPDDPDELIKLPGVGRYTAGAVASFAYEKPVPAVDTNVARVIRRVFFGTDASRISHPASRFTHPASRDIWDLPRTLVPKTGKRAWRVNQAVMELGGLICVAPKLKCPAW